MNNEFDNTTDDQIIAMLQAGPLTGDPVIEEAAQRMEGLLAMMRRMCATPPGADRIETVMQSHRAAIRMVRECIEELFGSVASLESEDAVLLRGPEPYHDAEAIIAALQRVASQLPSRPITLGTSEVDGTCRTCSFFDGNLVHPGAEGSCLYLPPPCVQRYPVNPDILPTVPNSFGCSAYEPLED